MRRGVEKLIEMPANIDGVDLALTTNGSMLATRARTLKEAGLRRVTVSLDSLDDYVFKVMNDVEFSSDAGARGHRGGRCCRPQSH